MNLIHLADQVDLYDKLPDGWLSGSVPDGWLSGSVKRPHHVCLTIWGTLLLPLSHIKSALNQIYSSNILNFAGGRLGAVNGMRKDGTVGRRHLQADEMWVGGDIQRGFDTAWGCYDACYNRFGL
uniref:Glycosyl-hydrolase family 116 catalytic region domain-containing protein n=1 Tax=Wuchereria bancrofti TaxID=6293 RepID=A0AAF5PZB5_WUCBA